MEGIFQKSTKTEHYSFSACYMMLLKNGINLLKVLAFPIIKQWLPIDLQIFPWYPIISQICFGVLRLAADSADIGSSNTARHKIQSQKREYKTPVIGTHRPEW